MFNVIKTGQQFDEYPGVDWIVQGDDGLEVVISGRIKVGERHIICSGKVDATKTGSLRDEMTRLYGLMKNHETQPLLAELHIDEGKGRVLQELLTA